MRPQPLGGTEAGRAKGCTEITRCRVCGNPDLAAILDLGTQRLTGVFPVEGGPEPTAGPLSLVKCRERAGTETCGLVQLKHSYDAAEMYGLNYGYRSGLNQGMVRHLRGRVEKVLERVPLRSGDLVIDVGSNDATLLRAYPDRGATLLGVDPTGRKFKKHYPENVELIEDFFSAGLVRRRFPGRAARVITSIAMFYDLESPLDFMRDVRDTLADDGVWVFEQSYLPSMLRANSFDTVCHEHLEYYGLRQVCWMAARAGLKVLDVELNDANGGSFAVTAAKAGSAFAPNAPAIDRLLAAEKDAGLDTEGPLREFAARVERRRDELRDFVRSARGRGKTVFGYGASTKGNVILQYCGFTADDLPCIAEVNEEKFGTFTPGTRIPIVSEAEAKARRPDYFVVLPWHFRAGIVEREKAFLAAGGTLVFPLPELELVPARP